jgi:hypothetical protein
MTLSDVFAKLRHVDLMVLDLEGAELAALRGMGFHTVQRRCVLIEARDVKKADSILSQHGILPGVSSFLISIICIALRH